MGAQSRELEQPEQQAIVAAREKDNGREERENNERSTRG